LENLPFDGNKIIQGYIMSESGYYIELINI